MSRANVALTPTQHEATGKMEKVVVDFLTNLINAESDSFVEGDDESEMLMDGRDVGKCILRRLRRTTIRSVAALFAILKESYALILDNRYSTIRDMYYSNVHIMDRQLLASNATAHLTQMLQFPREDLHITTTPKCIIRGHVVILEKNGNATVQVDCLHPLEDRGHLLSHMGVTGIAETSITPKFILVIEKETVFYSFLDAQFIERYGPTILLTAKGFPDMAARCLLWNLNKHFGGGVPIFILTDFDAHGLLIGATYTLPIRKMSYYSKSFAVPSSMIVSLPTPESAMLNHGLRSSDVVPIQASRKKLLTSLSSRIDAWKDLGNYVHPSWQEQVSKILHAKKQYELDALPNLIEYVRRFIDEEIQFLKSDEE